MAVAETAGDVLWHAALVPALGAWAYRRTVPAGALWIGLAFAISWLGDSIAWVTGGAWYGHYLWLPLQFALALWALAETKRAWAAWTAAIVGLSLTGVLITAPAPDVMVTAVGGAVVLVLAITTAHPLTASLVLYFGLGTVGYLVLVSDLSGPHTMAWWWTYQAARVAGWGAFGWTLWRYRHE